MEDRQRLNLEGLIKKLRSVTLAVQVMPFIYTAFYILATVSYFFADETVLRILDTLFYVSPIVVAEFLVLSRILRLCKWHRRACVLPVLPQVTVILDYTVVEFSRFAAASAIATILLMAVLLLIAAYNVFLKPKHNGKNRFKERTT